MISPVVRDSCACNEKQPLLHPLPAMTEINFAYYFEKDLRRQILSILSVPDLAIHIAIDQAKVLLNKCLVLLHIHGNIDAISYMRQCWHLYLISFQIFSFLTAKV